MKRFITESQVEEASLEILRELGYRIVNGPDIAPDGKNPQRANYSDAVLVEILREAIDKFNPNIPTAAKEEAIKKLLRSDSQKLIANNHAFHKMLVNGIDVEYRRDGRIVGDQVRLFDFEHPGKNEFWAVNQFTVIETNINRRADIALFVNGLPLVVIELKNPADEDATIWTAFNQLETYKLQIPALFKFNEILVISDGLEARAGTISSIKERFMPWKTIAGKKTPKRLTELEVLIRGMFDKEVLLDLARHFVVFEIERGNTLKKLAAYHQYNAVNNAVESTIKATQKDKRAGVVWHTQGSGKSLTMVFYAGKVVLKLDNPTLVLLTDRNDLDDQLFATFGKCQELIRQKPVQAESRPQLQELLKVGSGGIVFTTIQKFFPEITGDRYPLLSDRKNIIVIADEAHRSQYDFIDGFARHMRDALPNASFIGFTGTPIEREDRSTPAVFGKYVDIYDIEQAVTDNVTVRIYYESRLAKLELKPEERPIIDKEFEYVTEGEELAKKEKLKSKWARLEKIVGSPDRIKRVAGDIVEHYSKRQEILEGKGMIVCTSRRICVDLYNEIIKLKPEWDNREDNKGIIKIIMTGSATDPIDWQDNIRNKIRRKAIGERFKDPADPLKLVIVRDMWLTGFDIPCLHTMYIDKPMRGHGLMQAIARVNRVFKDKPGGLIVDYIGIAYDLKKALADYTEGDREETGIPQEEAVAIMKEKYEIVTTMFHGFDYKKFYLLSPKDKMSIIPQAIEHVLIQENGNERYQVHVAELSRAFALSVPQDEALKIKDEVGFFQAVKSAMRKTTITKGPESEDLDSAIKQIISKAIVSDRVIDIFAAAGLKKPDISILSEEFLSEVKRIPHKNLAFEMLKKLLNDEIKFRMMRNVVQARSFREMLENAIKAYINKTIETAQVIEELIELARKMRDADKRGDDFKLNEDELAFYDALADNDSAVEVLGNETLSLIARELVDLVHQNVTIDWTIRENVQAKLRVMVKKVLKKYGYPPDKQQKAVETVLEQANLICKDWAEKA